MGLYKLSVHYILIYIYNDKSPNLAHNRWCPTSFYIGTSLTKIFVFILTWYTYLIYLPEVRRSCLLHHHADVVMSTIEGRLDRHFSQVLCRHSDNLFVANILCCLVLDLGRRRAALSLVVGLGLRFGFGFVWARVIRWRVMPAALEIGGLLI